MRAPSLWILRAKESGANEWEDVRCKCIRFIEGVFCQSGVRKIRELRLEMGEGELPWWQIQMVEK